HFGANPLFDRSIADMAEHFGDPARDFFHFRLAHAARSYGGRAGANASGFHGRQGIEGDRVLIDGDAGAVEGGLRDAAGDAARVNFDQEEMIIGAAADDAE